MTEIYTDEGGFDHTEAARSLANIKHLGNDKLKAETVRRIEAAALVDIAASLNAIVQGLAGGGLWLDSEREIPEAEPTSDPYSFQPGDRVYLRIGDGGYSLPYPPSKVLSTGTTEGADWIELENYDDDGTVLSIGGRYWAKDYRLVAFAEQSETEDAEQPGVVETPEVEVEDIDDDFTETPEAEVKPAKVKSGKGKSKSKGGE